MPKTIDNVIAELLGTGEDFDCEVVVRSGAKEYPIELVGCEDLSYRYHSKVKGMLPPRRVVIRIPKEGI